MKQLKEIAINIDTDLVKRLIAIQFPQWRDLYIRPVTVSGWDNRTFHLGEHMLIRMPSAEEYVAAVTKEQEWLPRLAPLLPLTIPTPLAMGQPGEDYPYPWSVYQWIEGETVASTPTIDKGNLVHQLAQFIRALHTIDTTEAPTSTWGQFCHVGGLAAYDDETRRAIIILQDKIDADAAVKLWTRAVTTTWQKASVWVHGDLSLGNLLIQDGQLNAVIDFGGLGVGDPACDLVIAWKFFDEQSRRMFREQLSLDSATWDRGRAWALWKALFIAASLGESNAIETSQAWYTINETINDFKS